MSPHNKAMPKTNTLDVVVCRLRQKLKPHDIEIVTLYGQGFKLNENARDRVRRLAAASEAE